MERVWTPDKESEDAYDAAYEKASVTIGGYQLHPRDLDAYATIAYQPAGLDREDKDGDYEDEDEDEDGGDQVPGGLDAAPGCASSSSPCPGRLATSSSTASWTTGPPTASSAATPTCYATAIPRRRQRGSPRWSTSTRPTPSAPVSSPRTAVGAPLLNMR